MTRATAPPGMLHLAMSPEMTGLKLAAGPPSGFEAFRPIRLLTLPPPLTYHEKQIGTTMKSKEGNGGPA